MGSERLGGRPMALVQFRNVDKAFIDQEVLIDVSFQIQPNERVGLIGPNGAGKSTILKIIMGYIEPDDGELIKSGKVRIGYLAQDLEWKSDINLYKSMLEVFSDVFLINDRLRELEEMMGTQKIQNEERLYSKVMEEYSLLLQRYDEMDGYSIESRIKGVLKGLGFSKKDFQLKVSQLSGGQKTRAGLAKLLLTSPDLLLLDEPTNHLDLNAREWLEGFLKDYPGGMIIISHDRYFLDQTVNRILELKYGELEKYPGNYTFFLQERKKRLLEWQRKYEKQQEQIAQMEEFVRRFIAGSRSNQAKGRRKHLARMERIKRPPLELNMPKIYFTFERKSGNDVLLIDNLAKSYPGTTLFHDVSLNVYRGDKIAIIGPNGAGKSTFLKVLLGDLDADLGEIRKGVGVNISYYSQEHEDLNSEGTILDYFRYKYRLSEQEARDLLAKFLFVDNDVFKEIGDLSGGERSRIVLAELSLKQGNLLILDEPTNHLDVTATEVLEEALIDFPGTILMVSHDRFFVERIANKIWELDDGLIKEYHGGYSYFKHKKDDTVKALELTKGSKTKNEFQRNQQTRNRDRNLQKRIDELETKITHLETQKDIFFAQLADPELYKRSDEEISRKNQEYAQVIENLETLYQEWEGLIS